MTRATPVRVLVADDSAAIRSALAELIDSDADLSLVATAGDAIEAVELARREQPDVALVDLRMPGGGAVAVRGIVSRSPSTSVILLSASGIAPPGLETEIAASIAKGNVRGLVDAVKRAAASVSTSAELAR